MKQKFPLILGFGLVLALGLMPVADEASAQNPSGVGPTRWFDWSDFRSDVGIRLFLARLSSATIRRGDLGREFDLIADYGLPIDLQPFREIYATLYVDRLGLRYHLEDNRMFQGRSNDADANTLSVLDISATRLGVDLDLIRYPFIRVGIDFDYYNSPVKFVDAHSPYSGTVPIADPRYPGTDRTVLQGGITTFRGDEPLTIGIHGKAIPFRVREVPFTVQGRFRYPLPAIGRREHAAITGLDLCAGLRPNIWDTSMFGHSTFGATIEVGYRWERLDVYSYRRDMSLTATWHGAMCQFSLVF